MRVYQILFDGSSFFLEAESFGAAVTRWKIWMKNEYKEDYKDDWEPQEIILICDGFVLSKSQIDIWLSEEEEKTK